MELIPKNNRADPRRPFLILQKIFVIIIVVGNKKSTPRLGRPRQNKNEIEKRYFPISYRPAIGAELYKV